jgi:hypothetical protein
MTVGGQLEAPAVLPPGKSAGTHCTGVGRCEGVWKRENLLTPPGFKPRIVQPVASRFTDEAIPATHTHTHTQTIYIYIYIYVYSQCVCMCIMFLTFRPNFFPELITPLSYLVDGKSHSEVQAH